MKFRRADAHKKKRLGFKWRKPKGLQNKMRLRKRGYAPVVKVGFRSFAKTRYLFKGLKQVIVDNLEQLEKINQKTEAAIISSKIGGKKRLLLMERARKMKIKIINFNVESKIKEIKESFEERKTKRKEKTLKKEAKKKVVEKIDKSKKNFEAKKNLKSESKEKVVEKKEEKKKLDKVLTKKQ
ncbi:hypothetical protein CMO90_01510 [Candidatus Woesearchaeota archaeon]|jgi:large subunit ribosomal protein L32e|nr:hypothetical protein [Candidatus Woesearchaeota archaeon]|tara:strand:+ start:1750 stop:2295 length:546 start_codon:yes stop_codon:yes gene_type:complete